MPPTSIQSFTVASTNSAISSGVHFLPISGCNGPVHWREGIEACRQSVRVSWVKGHAKQSHIDKGITTALKKEGNHRADLAADEGASLHGGDLIKVAQHIDKRHVDYINFMINVVKHIVEAYVIHRTLCPAIKPVIMQIMKCLGCSNLIH